MNTLFQYLQVHGISQTKLAADLGISQSAMSLILSGKRKPGITVTKRIEALTGISRHSLRPDVYEAAQ